MYSYIALWCFVINLAECTFNCPASVAKKSITMATAPPFALQRTDYEEVDLFLLGKTGHGKSSTCNSILGREAFQVSDSSESETHHIQVGWSRRLGRIIKVVDGPGIYETRLAKGEAAMKMAKDMSQGILQCPNGFHALLLVLRYDIRFTEEELGTVQMLKELFGPTFVRDYCIIIFTHGELFDRNNKQFPDKTFSKWCQEQKGPLQTLLQECGNRVVLFYNSDPKKKEEQLQTLLAIVDSMKSKGVRYTNEIFKKAAASREQLIVKENAPELREKIQVKINLLAQALEELKVNAELTPKVQKILKNLKQDAIDLVIEIAVQDKGTGVLDSLKQVVTNILQNVESHEEALKHKKSKSEIGTALIEVHQKYELSLVVLQEEIKKANERNWYSFIIDILKAVYKLMFGGEGLIIGDLTPLYEGDITVWR